MCNFARSSSIARNVIIAIIEQQVERAWYSIQAIPYHHPSIPFRHPNHPSLTKKNEDKERIINKKTMK